MRLFSLVAKLSSSAYCTVDYLANEYQVSKRTIQNALSYLDKVSSNNGFKLHKKRGEGYLLEVVDAKLFENFLLSMEENDFFEVHNQRANFILTYLVLNSEYISMEQIADFFKVSRTLIKKNMPDVEMLAKKYDLHVERKSHYGLKIRAKRQKIIAYLVKEHLNENNSYLERLLQQKIPNFYEVEKDIIKILNSQSVDVYYSEYTNLIKILEIIILLNILKVSYVKEKLPPTNDSKIEQIVIRIRQVVTKKYAVWLDEADCNYISKILEDKLKLQLQLPSGEKLIIDIEDFLKQIDERYKTSFNQDLDFKKMLQLHTLMLMERLEREISYQNPLASELSIKDPMIFNIAINFGEMLNQKYDKAITFDELGFIAMHFAAHMEKKRQEKFLAYNKIGVICSSGVGSAYMLKLRLQSLFPNAQIKTFSFLKQERLLDLQPDIVFTVMPLSIKLDCPIVHIKELLNEQNIADIKKLVQSDLTTQKDMLNLKGNFLIFKKLFSKNFFKLTTINKKNYVELISEMANQLEKNNYGQTGYKDLVLHREEYATTIYKNGVCIPHPIETNAKKSVVYVNINKTDIPIEGGSLIFMICLRRQDVVYYKEVSKFLYGLMNSQKNVERLLAITSFEELMVIFKEIEGGIYG